MKSRELIGWQRRHERRAKRRGGLVAIVVAAAALAAFVWWRAKEGGPVAGSHAWFAGMLAAFGLAFMRVPFHMYWRQDAALLAQLPIAGGALCDAALWRCVRAAIATMIVVLIGAAPLALLDADAVWWETRELLATPIAGDRVPGLSVAEFVTRHVVLTGVMGIMAACLMPAVAFFAAMMVAHGQAVLVTATQLAGAPASSGPGDGERAYTAPGSAGLMLGALPGFAGTVVITLVVIAMPWLYNRETSLPAAGVLASLAVASGIAIALARASAPRVMALILRDVSALDRQRLATLEIRGPTAIERGIARLLGDAGLPYRKDARLMRRRYPMAFALGALCFIVLVIIGLARPSDPMPWIVAVVAGAAMYAIALGGRLFRPPIELPRLAATLPITAAARTRAKLAWVIGWCVVFVVIPLVFATVRLI